MSDDELYFGWSATVQDRVTGLRVFEQRFEDRTVRAEKRFENVIERYSGLPGRYRSTLRRQGMAVPWIIAD